MRNGYIVRARFKPEPRDVDNCHMPESIADILGRRDDLSTFLIHLCRERTPGTSAAQVLNQIVDGRVLRAMTPMGWAKVVDDPNNPDAQSQRTVCFSETPLQHIYSLFAEIEGRSICLKPYGVALTKVVARRLGVNPVWYVDMTTRGGREWEEARALDEIRREAIATGAFHSGPVAKILPFFEHMGTWPTSRKEFWWEREWRHRGDLNLAAVWSKLIWLAPEADHAALSARLQAANGNARAPIVLDPSWGIEQIIGRLCGLEPDDVSLFHVSTERREANGVIHSSAPLNPLTPRAA